MVVTQIQKGTRERGSHIQVPLPYKRPQQADQQKVIEDLQKLCKERFQNQEKKFQEIMAEM